MKKKAIEKIPYLTLPEVSKKKNVNYIGVTAVKIVGHEKHLFLEVYRNRKTGKDVPVVRVVLTKKDFENYFPETGEWTRKKIVVGTGYKPDVIWNDSGRQRETVQQTEAGNILAGGEDLERIKKFCKTKIWKEERWWEYITYYESRIADDERRKTEQRKRERRQQALDDRIAHTKPLPEQAILERADEQYFHHQHYLYYKKRGSWAQIACSKCGGVTDARWKSGISYESQFQRRIEEPREGEYGSCPMCGAYGQYKCQGKTKGVHSKTIHLFLGQKYKEAGMVLRYIQVEKVWELGLICTDNGVEMENAIEKLYGVEIARAYFEPGKDKQIDYQKHSVYSGEDYWDDCNLYGNANIVISGAPIMPETYREMAGTMFRYSALREYAEEVKDVNPIEYFERYQRTPQIEMLVKLGLTGVVKELIHYRYGIVACEFAKSPDVFLGIRKERVKQLIAEKGDIKFLEVMKMEYRMKRTWTNEQIEHLVETGLKQGAVEHAAAYMSLQQLLNRIEKYAGCRYGKGCTSAAQRIGQTAITYTDYLGMREGLGYDLNNTVYQQPRDLTRAHEQMVLEMDKEKVDARLLAVKTKFPNIRKSYRDLRKKYYYEDDDYIIRPARSAEEIVMEGRILHHCVGGDGYLEKHNDGATYILMLRLKARQETPYITVEIDGRRSRICQWYGAHDRKPQEKIMQQWLDGYVDWLRSESMKTENKAGNKKTTVRIPVAAIA